MSFENPFFNISLALNSVRKNKLRTGITIGIIALGITALVGILTAIDGLKSSIYSNFSEMGTNTFRMTSNTLRQRERGISTKNVEQKNISFKDALTFKDEFDFPAEVSISMIGSNSSTISHLSEKTNPNIRVMGVDENYLKISESNLIYGRNFSENELHSGYAVCIIGSGIAKKLFGNKLAEGINKTISIGFLKYKVIGIIEEKGGSMVSSMDDQVFVPVQNARTVFGGQESFVISIRVPHVSMIEIATQEAEGKFRIIRKIPLEAESNFSIQKNDRLASMVMEEIGYVSGAALFIGLITLFGAAIGLMNIMLVSVAERTREIGISKALGAKNRMIKNQFLTESVFISFTGGVIGVTCGILMGNIVSLLVGTDFIIPWLWIILGLSLCTAVGLISGYYPAAKASKLDPIEALRYE